MPSDIEKFVESLDSETENDDVEVVESETEPELNSQNGLSANVSRVVLQPFQIATYKQSGDAHLWVRCLGYKENNTFISVWRV